VSDAAAGDGDLVRRAARRARAGDGRLVAPASPARLAAYRARLAGARELVLTGETAVELGPPPRRSAHAVLWTAAPGLVADGEIVVFGPPLRAAARAARDYAQLVLLEVAAGVPDPARLEASVVLTRRLPGLMARMVPGRLWLRASRAALAAGLDFPLVAAALAEACRAAVPGIASVACLFASGPAAAVTDLAALAAEARARAGRHPRLRGGPGGTLECALLDCAACDERPVCDRIRAATAIGPAAPEARR
jgi:hypothetical protein